MTERDAGRLSSIRADDVPALAAFLRGYLHQDLVEEHGTAVRAFNAFWAEAGGVERRQFLEDWQTFRRAAGEGIWPEARAALARLGASWTPPTKRAFASLDRAVAAKRTSVSRSMP